MVLKGISGSPGIVIGEAFVLEKQEYCIYRHTISPDKVRKEISRFRDAISKVKEEIVEARSRLISRIGKSHAQLFDAYLLILEDKAIRTETENRIIKERVNAEFALQETIERILKTFSLLKDEYLKERARDIQDIGHKILNYLLGRPPFSFEEMKEGVIVVAHNITPADTPYLKAKKVKGFATDVGGPTSHTAIVARSLEIPAVVGLKEASRLIKTGDTLILDGDQGVVIVDPDEVTLENYKRQQRIKIQEMERLESLKDLPAVTIDGREIELAANIEVPEEVPSALAHGAQGIGLFRTEYIFMNREELPSEEEQFEVYKSVAEKVMPYSVIIRTLDLGADKIGVDLGIERERNPIMGLRAIRLCLKFRHIFKTQLRAILRASVYGNIKIMYPLISGVGELDLANSVLEEVKQELRIKGIPFNEKIEVGAMIEVPSAALTSDLIAKKVDFISIGTNDLIQYTLAVDRVNENVIHLYEPLHISILRLLHQIVVNAHKEGKWVGMCGEMAGDPAFTKILIGLGLEELSMSAISIPKVKQIIRSSSYKECKELVEDILGAESRSELLKIIKRKEREY
ncbi:MAG: phosphoenolpyruvate--protein phosphotransferase [Caldiserica bacterium]|nr:MAG: phosphoenolpyruvate--protein phosphotransferase [Caldisericota bacterium]